MTSPASWREAGRTQRALAVAALIASLTAIATLTLTPVPGISTLSFWCLKCGERYAVDVALNVFLFVPLGVGLGLSGIGFRRAALIALACTCLIETLQFWIPGRDASVRDIMANFLGGMTGIALGRDWRVLARPNHRAARVVGAFALALWVLTQALTAWAMQISPPSEPWWSQRLPERDNYPAYFKGTLLEFSLGTVEMRENDELPSETTVELRKQLLAGAPLKVVVTDVGKTRRLGAVAIISGGPVNDVVWYAFDGRDGVYGATVHGTLIGLRTPTVRIPNVVFHTPGDTIELTGSYHHGVYELRSRSLGGARLFVMHASPSMGWAFVLPFPLYAFDPNTLWLTALFVFAVWCLFGYWNARSVEPSNVIVPAAQMIVAVVLGLWAIPMVFAIPVAHWSEWLAAIAGAAVGGVVASRIKRGSEIVASS